ncbi:centrosomal protein of 112 kDa-like isoform X2 [Corticium candelabrum]|uniref:centrosomal protein of 112 kDa-like isoform X2 n=1 Tax=Corticium candelabrum TaxID=121492 RepID=UPI002E260C88|nr:centrosomal protein of 112 kDa-like isoform X2 [Corticium candelabrum]
MLYGLSYIVFSHFLLRCLLDEHQMKREVLSESADEHDQSSGSDHNLTQSSQQLQDAVGRTESKESTSKQNQEKAADQECVGEGSKNCEEFLKQVIEDMTEEMDCLREEIAEVTQQKEKEMNSVMKDREIWEAKNAQLQKRIEKLEIEKEELHEAQLHLQEAADQEREGSKKYEELVRQLTEEVDRGREESNATRREIAEVIQQKENELNEAMKCREVLQTENAQLRKQIEKLQEELKEVQLHSQHSVVCDASHNAEQQDVEADQQQSRMLKERETLLADFSKLQTEHEDLRLQYHDIIVLLKEEKLDELSSAVETLQHQPNQEVRKLQSFNLQLQNELWQQTELSSQVKKELQLLKKELAGKATLQDGQSQNHLDLLHIHDRVKQLEMMMASSVSSGVSTANAAVSAVQLDSMKGPCLWLPLSRVVEDDDIEVIALEASSKWKQLGRNLTFRPVEVDDIVSQIKYDNPRDSDRLFILIDEWRSKIGRQATLGKLLEACQKVGKQTEVEAALSRRRKLPKITNVAVHCTSRILTGGVTHIVSSTRVAEARRSPVRFSVKDITMSSRQDEQNTDDID